MFEYAWNLQNRIEKKLYNFSKWKYYDLFLMENSIIFAALIWMLAYGGKPL